MLRAGDAAELQRWVGALEQASWSHKSLPHIAECAPPSTQSAEFNHEGRQFLTQPLFTSHTMPLLYGAIDFDDAPSQVLGMRPHPQTRIGLFSRYSVRRNL